MYIDLTRLKNDIDEYIEIDEEVTIEDSYIETSEIEELKKLKIKGYITKNSINNYLINVDVTGTMILKCAVTLKPVDYDFNIKIDENLDEIYKEISENDIKLENTIDIFPIIWENILMEIPMKVVSEEAENIELKGDGWQLITERKAEINPAFKELNKLLDEEERC